MQPSSHIDGMQPLETDMASAQAECRTEPLWQLFWRSLRTWPVAYWRCLTCRAWQGWPAPAEAFVQLLRNSQSRSGRQGTRSLGAHLLLEAAH